MTIQKIDANAKTIDPEIMCSWRTAEALGFIDPPTDIHGCTDHHLSYYESALLELSESRDRILKLESDLEAAKSKIRKAKKALRSI